MILGPFDIISFLLGIILLNYCSELLIDNGSLLAKKYNISKMIIGMTLVAFGTSLPEFVVSLFASFQGKIDLVMGNVVGSNIANIGLVLGLSGIIYKIRCNFKEIRLDITFLIITTISFLGILYFNQFDDLYAFFLILILFIYIYILIKFNKVDNISEDINLEDDIVIDAYITPYDSSSKLYFFIILGALGLAVGSYFLIESSILIARYFNIPEMVIGATAIALGTSLPELVTSLKAAKKNEFELVLGNIFGSNIINIVLVFSTSLLINNNIPQTKDFTFDVQILLLLTFLLILGLIRGLIHRFISLLFLGIYIYYITLIL